MADKSLDDIKKYEQKAREELRQLDKLLEWGSLALCASRCYYAAFYAMKAVLKNIAVKTSSHKQTQISFRKHFIKTGKIDKKFSKTLTELFETRSKADYDINWVTNKPFVARIVRETKEFVETILGIIES